MIEVFENALKFVVPYAYIFKLHSWMLPDERVGKIAIQYRTLEKKVTMGHQLSRDRTSILGYLYYGNSNLAQRVELSIDLAFVYIKDGKQHIGRVVDKRIIPAYTLVFICQAYAFVKGS